MAVLQKLHGFAGKIDPVVKWADKKGLTPSFLYPPAKAEPERIVPVTVEGKKRAAAMGSLTLPPVRASAYLSTKGSGLLGGGGGG